MERNPAPAYRDRVINSDGSEGNPADDYCFSDSEAAGVEASDGVADSLSVAGAVCSAGALTLLVVWPDTGPCLAPPQHPSPQPAIPIAVNTASAATVFSHSRLI